MLRILFILLLNVLTSFGQEINYTIHDIDPNTKEVKINVNVGKDDFIYKDFLKFSVNYPDIAVSEIKFSKQPTEKFDAKQFKQTKLVYKDNFDISVLLKKNENKKVESANLLMHYLTTKDKNFKEKIFKIDFDKEVSHTPEASTKVEQVQNQKQHKPLWSVFNKYIKKALKVASNFFYKVKNKTSSLLQGDSSITLKILLAFILGLVLSLTPCIYPMIPITVGILQQNTGKSFFKNFVMAACYTLGIAITFASFGLIASLGGPAFGQLLGNPIFVIILVALLAYLGFSMLGFYEMYIPSFLTQGHHSHKGSYVSAFIFGAMSGTIASPCLSPGLVLILSIVATMGNKLLGFLMLFAFGIGSSMPLLIIATFSASLNLLPKAGMWMVEIKKIMGLMLLGMCFYYLKAILPHSLLLWLLSSFLMLCGIYYIFDINKHDSKFSKQLKTVISLILITLGIFTIFHSCKKCCASEEQTFESSWVNTYDSALKTANQENKKLFVDIGAQWCTICKAIDSKVFENEKVKSALNKFVQVKIDATNASNPDYILLKEKYQIKGFPTILIIDPKSGDLNKKWMGELYDMPIDDFVKELESVK